MCAFRSPIRSVAVSGTVTTAPAGGSGGGTGTLPDKSFSTTSSTSGSTVLFFPEKLNGARSVTLSVRPIVAAAAASMANGQAVVTLIFLDDTDTEVSRKSFPYIFFSNENSNGVHSWTTNVPNSTATKVYAQIAATSAAMTVTGRLIGLTGFGDTTFKQLPNSLVTRTYNYGTITPTQDNNIPNAKNTSQTIKYQGSQGVGGIVMPVPVVPGPARLQCYSATGNYGSFSLLDMANGNTVASVSGNNNQTDITIPSDKALAFSIDTGAGTQQSTFYGYIYQ